MTDLPQLVYREHRLVCSTLLTEDGRYQARVAIADMRPQHTRTQSFLDLEVFKQPGDALEHALSTGRAWVDKRCTTDASDA